MEWLTDFTALDDDVQVVLACMVGSVETICVARLHWFEEGEGRVQKWQSTWDGSVLPPSWKPYAYWIAKAPDPALIGGDDDGY